METADMHPQPRTDSGVDAPDRSHCLLHLGFPTIGSPLFDELVASSDPVDHVAFAADHGFLGVLDPFAAMRSAADQSRIGDAALRRGLEMGSALYAPFDAAARFRWASPDPEARAQVLADLSRGLTLAARLGSRALAIIALAERGPSIDMQHATMAETLRRAGDLAGAAGVTLLVEGVNPERLPRMLLHGVESAASVVRGAAHPMVGLLLDTGHAAAVGENPAEMVMRHHAIVGAVQIADHPGRVEMGAGIINWPAFMAAAEIHRLDGRFELEHRWSRPGASVQTNYVQRLRNVRQQR